MTRIPLSPHDKTLILQAITWLRIVNDARPAGSPPVYPGPADIESSALFKRIRAGLTPMPWAPPTRHGQPAYDLIENARGRLSRALVYEAISREVVAKPTRTNTAAVFNIVATDFLSVLAQLRMSACLGVPLRQFEALTVLHYDEGEEITEHYDFVDPNLPSYAQEIAEKGDRVVTFLVYLNDDYQGGDVAEKMRMIHERTLVIAMIETAKGLDNVEAIAAVPGVDVLWLGHFDLTNFLGIPGDFSHPRYEEAIKRITSAASRHGKAAGYMAADATLGREYLAHGFRMIATGTDQGLLQAAIAGNIGAWRSK